MFYWMNRRLYHFLKEFIKMLARVLFTIFVVFVIIYIASIVETIWGRDAVAWYLIGVMVIAVSGFGAYLFGDMAYEKEVEDQKKVERRLRKDW